jgi:hypothetical protein
MRVSPKSRACGNVSKPSSVAPEGLPRLFAARKAYRTYISDYVDDRGMPILTRMRNALARVKRAEFISLTHVEVDMVDKVEPSRMIHATLGLTQTGWILKGLRLSHIDGQPAQIQPLITTTTARPREAQAFQAVSRSDDDLLDPPSSSFIAETEQKPRTGFWSRLKAAAQPR